MINERSVYAYCREDISRIENYEQALADQTQTWHCHHKAEILPCGRFSKEDLKRFGLYYNQPASMLVFMTQAEHRRLHCAGQKLSSGTRAKISKALTGKKQSEVTIRKRVEKIKGRKNPNAVEAMRKARTGAHSTPEANEANRKAHLGNQVWLGKRHTEETKQKLSKARKGKPGHLQTGESRNKISTTKCGARWYTNGVVEICTHGERPAGFVPGRLKKL